MVEESFAPPPDGPDFAPHDLVAVPPHRVETRRFDQLWPELGLDLDAEEFRDPPHLAGKVAREIGTMHEKHVLARPGASPAPFEVEGRRKRQAVGGIGHDRLRHPAVEEIRRIVEERQKRPVDGLVAQPLQIQARQHSIGEVLSLVVKLPAGVASIPRHVDVADLLMDRQGVK